MRIGLSLTPLFKQKRDGIFTYTQAIFEQLAKTDCEIVGTSFMRNEDVQIKSTDFLGNYEVCLMLQLLGIPVNKLNELEDKIDLYHITDHRIVSLRKKPTIANLYDAVPLKNPLWANPNLRQIKNVLMKKTVQWVDHILAISQAAVPDIVEYWGVDESKISVVHLGVSDFWMQTVLPDQKQEVLNKYQLPEHFILFVGTIQPRKNLERLLQAFKQLPEHLRKEHQLVLVAGRGWMDEEVVQTLNKEMQTGQVHWLKDIPYEDLRCLYQSAVLFAFPSLYEGFGLPILEAFASKTAVLTSNVSALPEVAGDAALLVDPYDTNEMTEKMREILESPAMRAQYVLKGAERVKAFTWEKCMQQTLNVYRKFK